MGAHAGWKVTGEWRRPVGFRPGGRSHEPEQETSLMTMTCGEALVQLLERYGVDTVFGIPGVHNLAMYRGLTNSSITHVQARNEQGAGFMADGYARASGRPGVCFVISGPGVTNAATRIGQSFADSIPVLLISTTTASHTHGKGWGALHEITDQEAVTRPITALSATAMSPEDLPELVGQAFTIFASQRPRPAHISLPVDVAETETEGNWNTVIPPARPSPDPGAVAAAAAMLLGASRPSIYVGGGAAAAGTSITAIAERIGASVFTSNAGRGIVADSHPLNVGGSIWRQVTQDHICAADVVLAIGTELAETDSFIERLPLTGKVIRVDIDPAKINDLYPAEVGIVADAATTAAALMEALGAGVATVTGTAERVAATKAAVQEGLADHEKRHVVALEAIRRALPADTILMNDIAQMVYTGSAMFPVEAPRLWHYPAGFCTLGCGMPDAIGAKMAFPDRPVATLAGDGGFMFTPQELTTASELGLAIPIVIWNNGGLKQITDDMEARNIKPLGTDGINPDFMLLAEAMGAHGVRPGSSEELEAAVTNALAADRPTIIELFEGSDWLQPA